MLKPEDAAVVGVPGVGPTGVGPFVTVGVVGVVFGVDGGMEGGAVRKTPLNLTFGTIFSKNVGSYLLLQGHRMNQLDL